MKKIVASILGFAAALGFSSCSEDFNVAAPYKNITVGYGIVNINDTAHYIRIQKAFLDENKSAIDMSQVSDSSYFSSLDVNIKEINNANSVVSTTALTRVDLAAEGYPKEPGAFFNAPNYAYKFKKALNPGNRYRLVIRNNATGETDSAETNIITNDTTQFFCSQFRLSAFRILFTTLDGTPGKFNLSVQTPPNSEIFDCVIRFHWVDKVVATGQQTDHYADWLYFTGTPNNFTAGKRYDLSTDYNSFFSVLANTIKPAAPGVERYMDSCDVFIWAGTPELSLYKQYQLASGGLAGDQIKPNYTNFKGANVLGIFTSRMMIKNLNVPIDPKSLDSLKINPVTASLNIKGLSDH